MEEQLMGPWQPFKPPSPGLVFFLNMLNKPQVRAVKNKFLACMQRSPACVVLHLEIRPRSGQSPCRSEGCLLVRNCLDYMPSDGRLRRKCLIKSMVLQVHNLHIRNRESFPIPCFSAQFTAYAHQCGDAVFSQLMVIWSDAWCCNCHQLLIDLTSDGATSLLMISSNWYAKLNFLRVMPLEILDIYFRPMVIAAQGWQYQNWNNFPSVSLWIQVNIVATVLSHQLRSHKMNDLHEQQRFWNCVYVFSTINRGGTSPSYEQDCLFMNSKCTWFFLPDGLLVDDVVLSPFGLFHQRWTTTSLSLIPRFNGGDPLRLSSVMVHQYLQLNPPKPRVHTPDRPSGEPPAGHQLVWSTMEALEDCRCSNIESVLSADD